MQISDKELRKLCRIVAKRDFECLEKYQNELARKYGCGASEVAQVKVPAKKCN